MTMSQPFHEKSLPNRIRHLAADIDEASNEGLVDHISGMYDTLYEIAQEVQELLEHAADELGRPITDAFGDAMTHVAEMYGMDDLYTVVLEAKDGKP